VKFDDARVRNVVWSLLVLAGVIAFCAGDWAYAVVFLVVAALVAVVSL
jgi:hypothetical protein